MRRKPGEFPDSDYDDVGSDYDISPALSGGIRGRFSQLVNLRTFESLRNPAFRLYWSASLCQMTSMNMQIMARSLLIYRLTGSTTVLGIMSLFHAIPMLFLSLFGGVIADRVQKKYAIMVGQAASAVVSLAVALTLMSGYLSETNEGSWWVLAIASLFQGIVMGLMMPSRQAMVPELVGEEQLLNALSLNNVGMSSMRFISPAVAGFLIEAFDFEAVYFTMTGMYLLAVLLVSFLPRTGTTTLRGSGALNDIREGIKYLRHQTTIIFILLLTLFAVLLSMPYMMLMPVFTDDILKVGADGYGILMSVSGIGSIVGSIALASLPNRKRGLLLLLSSLTIGISLTAFAFSTSWPLSLGLIVFVGLGTTGRMTLGNTLIQYYVDPEYRGRVMSVYMMEFGLTSFGTVIAGVLADTAIGVQWTVGGFSMVLIVISLAALVFAGRLRRLD
ncbi:MAG TPA: MFS transporter [Dehalococcoidia bacterium]|nr:MFS transporter [Dehalococcoidia bacterium]